ncbi:MAG: right-handed parallel beta-helix repeat-containing protein [Phycisphaerales bacterium]
MKRLWTWQFVIVVAVGHLRLHSVWATQHLVSPGQDWQELAARVHPGDEIILMPGRHRPATLDRLQGKQGKPITIRALDPERPSVIEASRYGLVLHKPQHVVIENIIITGATICGLLVDDLDSTAAQNPTEPALSAPRKPWRANLVIRNVSVTNTGPQGKRHAIELSGLQDVRIHDVHIEGWGGSGLELIGCHGVTVESCRFIAREDYSQLHAIQIRAGSERVNIMQCHFQGISEAVVMVGGLSKLREFRPEIPPDADSRSHYEARFVQLQRCTFLGGACPIVLAHCDDTLMRNSTFIRPRHAVLCTTSEQTDHRIAPARRAIFGGNLLVWEPGDLRRLVDIAPADDAQSFVFEESLWWSTEPAEQRARLRKLPGARQTPQITDLDPKLDDELRPTEPKAAQFGAKAL